MYVQHDIYDLIFKYVGTMEAAEVGSVITMQNGSPVLSLFRYLKLH